MKKRSLFLCAGNFVALCVFLFFIPALSRAADFGVVLDQVAGFGGYSSEGTFDYKGSLIPRFSTPIGKNGGLYTSAGINAEYANKEWTYIPELLRTELTWYFNWGDLKIGRIYYSDPLGFIAAGLFDGARISYDTSFGTFGLGAWYTGFLYKKRANIHFNYNELLHNSNEVDYDDFTGTYFAFRRLVSALEWSHPSLGGSLLSVNTSLLCQVDFTGEDLHSQYIIAKLSLPVKSFLIDLGGSFELKEISGDLETALAAELKAAWTLPTIFASRLSLLGRYASGLSNSTYITPFLPVTTKTHGSIINAKTPGTSMISLDYIARLHRTFSAGVTSSYFIRSGSLGGGSEETFFYDNIRYYVTGDGYFLGNEFFGRLYWSPFSDLTATLGGGIFLPSLGNSKPEAESLWRVELNIVFSLI